MQGLIKKNFFRNDPLWRFEHLLLLGIECIFLPTPLFTEVAKAVSLADDNARAKEKFQQQSYAKFCVLINSKKKKILQLEQTIKSLSGKKAF